MHLQLVQPEKTEIIETKVSIKRKPYKEVRNREFLTKSEIDSIREAVKKHNRHGKRDAFIITMMYRHALRAQELCDLTWDVIQLDEGQMTVNRIKNGIASRHYLEGDEIRTLRAMKRESNSRFVFCSQKNGPLTTRAIHMMITAAGEQAGLEIPIHPHMLRHSKGYQLANQGQDTRAIQGYLGHKDIKSTVVYTNHDPSRYKGFGKE